MLVLFFCLDLRDSFISTIVAVDDSPRVVLFTFCVHFTTKRAAQPSSKKEMFELAVHIRMINEIIFFSGSF